MSVDSPLSSILSSNLAVGSAQQCCTGRVVPLQLMFFSANGRALNLFMTGMITPPPLVLFALYSTHLEYLVLIFIGRKTRTPARQQF